MDTGYNCDDVSQDELILEEDGDRTPSKDTIKSVCTICRTDVLLEPMIRCAECNEEVLLCLQCFSFGLETKKHHCEHSYHIERRHIPRDETNWTLSEDRDLLQGVLECGYGNQVDLCKRFMHRTTEEITTRVETLLGLDKSPLLSLLDNPDRPTLPYDCDSLSENPPRYPPKGMYCKHLGGYNPARSDFTSEYCNKAEYDVTKLSVSSDAEDSDEELTSNINCAIVEYHNEVLRDRSRRKAIIKEHALLLRRTPIMLHSSPNARLTVFLQLVNRFDFDSLFEGLELEDARVKKLNYLRKYRKLGIKRLRGCQLYERLEQMRGDANTQHFPLPLPLPRTTSVETKQPRALNIEDFSGYNLLNEDERSLCATGRILPEIYLKGKQMFIEVSKRDGSIKLKAARQLLKIDVNKTRKIFNYLRDKRLIVEAAVNTGIAANYNEIIRPSQSKK